MNIDQLRDSIIERRTQTADDRACLVGVSGIDASGKGYVSSRLAGQLAAAGQRVALINVDGWLNLPHVRFLRQEAGWWISKSSIPHAEGRDGKHFYHHALRLNKMFEQLVLPLKQNRKIKVAMEFAEETATQFRPHTYSFENIDIILLEGIFIFKREFVTHFDMKIWIECRFKAALNRAIERGQEDLSPADTIAAYETIYFPAQRYHVGVDDPVAAADIIYCNT